MGSAEMYKLLAVVSVVVLLKDFLWSLALTIASLILSRWDHRPVRLDLRIPGFPVDVVFVTDPEHVIKINTSNNVDRLHCVEYASFPPWFRYYTACTRFVSRADKTMFLPLEPVTSVTYAARRARYIKLLDHGHTEEDVCAVKGFADKGDDYGLSLYLTNMINRRFLGASIPLQTINDAKAVVTKLPKALNPFKYFAGLRANENLSNFITKCPQKDTVLTTGDCMHNLCATAETLPRFVMALKNNPNTPLHDLFTGAQNPSAVLPPRLAVNAASNFPMDGCAPKSILRYNTVPGKTVFIFKLKEAASTSKSIYFTFGEGDPHNRLCAFFPYFESFMGALQNKFLAEA